MTGMSLPLLTNLLPRPCSVTTVVGAPVEVRGPTKRGDGDLLHTIVIAHHCNCMPLRPRRGARRERERKRERDRGSGRLEEGEGARARRGARANGKL